MNGSSTFEHTGIADSGIQLRVGLDAMASG